METPVQKNHLSQDTIARDLCALSPEYAETPLVILDPLARDLHIAAVYAKDESKRMLGSFKSLGGTYAGLRALAAAKNIEFGAVIGHSEAFPDLITASAGNHGLAVASAAKLAGSKARIFLYPGVSDARRRRIADLGAEIVEIDGTYDDAVEAAKESAMNGAGILVADTSDDPDDPIVADVIAGYGVISSEIRRAIAENDLELPTHLFIQAGVGGIAAALTSGLRHWMAAPARIIAIEPRSAACLGAALAAGSAVRVPGVLSTSATMLACGEASVPALAVLRAASVEVIALDEAPLRDAPSKLRDAGGPETTPSGAAGLAGLLSVAGNAASRQRFGLTESSRVLIVITEGPLSE